MIQILLLAAVTVSALAHGIHHHEVHHAPQPYSFGYSVKDKHGEQHRQESGDGHGGVKGSYGFTDHRGISRQVDYVADKGGFRAQVKTNEPGTANQNPAAVKMISSADSYSGAGYGHGGYDIGGHGGLGYAVTGHGYGGQVYAGNVLNYDAIGQGRAGLGYGNVGLGHENLGLGHGNAGLGYGHVGLRTNNYEIPLGGGGHGYGHGVVQGYDSRIAAH